MAADRSSAIRRTVEIPSGRISYLEQGSGPIALFVDGVLLNSYLWRHELAGLSDIRRCIAVDLLAHGYTEIAPDQDVSVTASAKMLGEFLDALAIDQVNLVGNDSDAGIAQIFAATHPERVHSRTLTDGDTHDKRYRLRGAGRVVGHCQARRQCSRRRRIKRDGNRAAGSNSHACAACVRRNREGRSSRGENLRQASTHLQTGGHFINARHTTNHSDRRHPDGCHSAHHSASGDPECHGSGPQRTNGRGRRPGHRADRTLVQPPSENGAGHL
jgi:pimeloyl-ACP methyl ester carboxylesterase